MRVDFYGTRGVYPSKGGQMSCAFVATRKGKIMIDAGSASVFEDDSLIAETDQILITHKHPDHIAFLASFILRRMSLRGRSAPPCRIAAPAPLSDYFRSIGLKSIERAYSQEGELPIERDDLQISAIPTRHSIPSYAYRLEEEGRSIVFTGDATYSAELVEFCREADLLICDSSMADENKDRALRKGHLCPDLTARLICAAQPQRSVLTHFLELEGGEYRALVKSHLERDAQIIIAHDGDRVEVE